MRIIGSLAAAAFAAASFATFAAAEAPTDVLTAAGYRDVRGIGDDGAYVTAIDPQGSEVLLLIDESSGEVIEKQFLHFADR